MLQGGQQTCHFQLLWNISAMLQLFQLRKQSLCIFFPEFEPQCQVAPDLGPVITVAKQTRCNEALLSCLDCPEPSAKSDFSLIQYSYQLQSSPQAVQLFCSAGKTSSAKVFIFQLLCCAVSLQMVVVWNTAQVTRGGEVMVLARAHTDVDIQTLKIAFFDDTR